ncbi:hypothetical protein [Tateyamaria sp. ANG-S1]|uniref:hypothetical protein n=1 Tax=Tateyamaria sp. ANG-S1 TaxID=1577905 RepID=UPI00057F2DBF|nr:hypothetical protein [Tateyamaria sp. ANG-S1]KIC51743.1 hypothetical protein RA29_00020 [Tateyamaria sp. ANG-S1]
MNTIPQTSCERMNRNSQAYQDALERLRDVFEHARILQHRLQGLPGDVQQHHKDMLNSFKAAADLREEPADDFKSLLAGLCTALQGQEARREVPPELVQVDIDDFGAPIYDYVAEPAMYCPFEAAREALRDVQHHLDRWLGHAAAWERIDDLVAKF